MKRVVVAPLDWGLGHASRCVPIINGLLALGCEVVMAGSGPSLALLKEEFPKLETFLLPSYNPVYPKNESMVWTMARQLPHFVSVIRAEHRELKNLIVSNKIQGVISDNRFGCWSENIPCVFITHQSNIMMPQRFGWLSPLVRSATIRYMRKYSACWIPDFEGNKLSGELSSLKYGDGINAKFIGPLSRFQKKSATKKIYDVVAVLSGPEPQRSLLEERIVKQLESSQLEYQIVRGLPGGDGVKIKNSINFLGGKDLQSLLDQAKIIIARSGYSTVMDMSAIGARTIFIPTPGQTEQEYLAKRLKEKGIAFSMPQDLFNLTTALSESERYSGFIQKDDMQIAPQLNVHLKQWVTTLS